jgi:predicted RNA-binding Zn ribbon-like protein
MNFTSYTDWSVRTAVDLVRTLDSFSGVDSLTSVEELRRFLQEHQVEAPRSLSEADLRAVRAVRGRIRAVFEAETEAKRGELLNGLLAESRTLPQVTDHDGDWHFHYVPPGAPVARRLAATAGMALAVVIAEFGHDRLGICAADRCVDVYVDTSRNRSRRYCADSCASRMNVAAYRARQRLAGSSSSATPVKA